MRTILLASLLLAACATQPPHVEGPAPFPNRVCVIAATIEHGGQCDDLGRGVGPAHSDVALWHRDSGVKLCWETFDAKQPLACPPLVLTKAETAEMAVQQERAKQAEAAKQAAQVKPAAPDPAKPKASKP